MAVQTTPHTNTQQNVDSAAMDLEPGINRQDLGRGEDSTLYENSDGAQTGGPRAFHSNDNRDHSLKSEGDTGVESGNGKLPTGSGEGITNAGAEEERKQQGKVTSS
jgi:hypothetical protein